MVDVSNQYLSVLLTLQGAFTQISCSSPLYIGGVPEYDKTKRTAGVIKPFTGTIQKVFSHTNTCILTLMLSQRFYLVIIILTLLSEDYCSWTDFRSLTLYGNKYTPKKFIFKSQYFILLHQYTSINTRLISSLQAQNWQLWQISSWLFTPSPLVLSLLYVCLFALSSPVDTQWSHHPNNNWLCWRG